MKLSNFIDEIDPVILKRGHDYFQDGHILGMTSLSEGWYEMLVVGHDDYKVSIQLAEDGTILKASCACPYKGGPICKHEVAAFYSLSHSFKLKDNELEDVLRTLPVETLIAELIKVASRDHDVYEQLMTYKVSMNELASFEIHLEEVVANHVQLGHCISGHAIERLVDDLQRLLEEIQQNRPYGVMCEMALLLREECEGIEDQIDDSGAIFADFLGELHARLQSIVFMTMDYHQDVDDVFSLLISRLEKNKAWIDFELLDLVSEYGRRPDYLELIIDYIAKKIKEVDEKIQATLYKRWYELLVKYQEESIDSFLNKYGHLSVLKEFQVERFVQQKQYEAAIPLILELEVLEENRYDSSWKEYRYHVYELAGASENMKLLARELFLEGHFNYYTEMKKLYQNDFPLVYEELKQTLAHRPLAERGPYLKMIEEEHDVEALLAYVKEDVHSIEKVASLLWDTYETEVQQLYEQYILQETEQVNHRNGYRRICSMIRRFRSFTTKEDYQRFIHQLILMYPRRKALIEELNGLIQEVNDEKRIPSIEQLSIEIA